jgi:PAS domain S-box-containing protein
MVEFFKRLFASDFLPHGTCYLWNPGVLWLNVISDSLIALAYYTIPVLLFVFARKRRDLTFHRIFLAFGVFILACGTTHVMGVWTVWHPTYRLDGFVKAITAVASLATAGLLVPLLPALVHLPGPTKLASLNQMLESQLQEREEATQLLLEQAGLLDLAHDAIVVRRLNGTILFWNRGAETMYGWPKSEALGQASHDLLKTRLSVPVEGIFAELAEKGRWEGELVHTKRDGATVIVSSRWASRRQPGGEIEILEINTDITRQKSAEERLRNLNQELEQRVIERTAELRRSNQQLRESMDRYRFLADSMPQIVWTTKPDGSAEYFNRRWHEYCGSFDQNGQGWHEAVHPDDLPIATQKWRSALETGQSYEAECRLQSAEQVHRWHLVRALPMRSEDGAIAQWVGTCTDIHDQKSSAELLERTNRDLREEMARRQALEEQLLQSQKMEAIGRLAGGVAHDFNNLLTIMIGHGRLLSTELESDSPIQERLTQMMAAADRAAGLTNQLLAFSRRQMIQPRVLNLNAIVESAGKMVHRVIGEDVQLVTVLSPDLGNTKVDPGQIEQVLLNLIINARDAMPQGGKISVKTANVELDDRASARLGMAPGKCVMLAVSDTGVGMDAAVLAHVFEPFFTTKEPGKGTGLGLSTVYGIVKQSGGEVSVESEPGQGTTFRLYLPRIFEAAGSGDKIAPAAGAARGTETILLVEDDPGVRKLARDLLSVQGYTVLECAGGAETLELCSRHQGPFHLLLTDVVMPGMTGAELAKKIERLYPQIAILFMTGYTEDAVVHHGIVHSRVRLLQKPFTPDGLARAVRGALDAPRSVRVLVVDDEPDVRSVVREMLEPLGYEVSEASDGPEALAQFHQKRFDLMITDVVVSEKDGLKTAQTLRNQFPGLKIVVMSGALQRGVAEVAGKLGADATLQKPIQADQLLSTVQRLVGQVGALGRGSGR